MRTRVPPARALKQRAVVGCALLNLLAVIAFAGQEPPPAPVEHSVSVGGTTAALTVIAEGISLRDVLQYIAHHQQLHVEAHTGLYKEVSVEIIEQPLDSVIRRLLRDYNFMLRFNGGQSPGGYLWIYPRTQPLTTRLPQPDRFGVADVDDVVLASLRAGRGTDAERLDATSVMSAFGGDEAFVGLADAIFDPSPDVRAESVVGLGDHHAALSVALLSQALFDADWQVVDAAIHALAEIGNRPALRSLSPLLQHPDRALRLAVVDALGEVESDAATELLRRAQQDDAADIRAAASDYIAERRAGLEQ